jgi:polyketide cyclase/dehydrase/lipid transport protein
MPSWQHTYRVDRTPDQVFDVVGTNLFANHPRWEPEVEELRPLTDGPIRVGSRALMVRRDMGRRSEIVYLVTEFEPSRHVAVTHPDGPMAFDLRFDLAPAGQGATDFTVSVRMGGRGFARLLNPLIALQLPRRSDRLTRATVRVIESQTAPRAAAARVDPALAAS